MRGVKSEIFGGLVRSPPTTVDGFVAEATNIERALSARAVHYQRLAGVSTVPGVSPPRCNIDGVGIEHLRQIIRDVVRDELRKLLPASNRPASLSIAEVVREEVQRACQPDTPIIVPAPEEPALSYAAMARRHTPVAPQPRQQPAPRKTDVWRTADRRPLCYHCGEAGHIYRRCPYRQLGLRGFHPNDPRPRYDERPRDIEEYLRRSPSPVSSLRHCSRDVILGMDFLFRGRLQSYWFRRRTERLELSRLPRRRRSVFRRLRTSTCDDSELFSKPYGPPDSP
ncbi:hypothetical protein HPB47_002562 [Ixodes persulcatus]|uniref:Uncharacterized protein n=1 Tax=Ixodes persulcatus TaxID=34615 RepID=A0AC60PL82_IXOPE|nr:hypothetical protein HPB47_002562 [Ixodes persulcatus]